MFARCSSSGEKRGVTSPGVVSGAGSSTALLTVFMWGGYASGGAAASSSSMQVGMVEFDVPSVFSRDIANSDPPSHVTWRRSQPQGGAGPNPRARCASCICEGTLWIHGGVCLNSRTFGLFGQNEAVQDEICSFDIESLTWLRVVCSGNTASPALQAHAITPSGSDATILLVFGGLDYNGKPSPSLHSIRTLDESRSLKSPAQFSMESERDEWRIKFIQEAQNHRAIAEKFQGSHMECEDLKRRSAFLQTSCLNLERELVSRDEQLVRQRSVIQQLQKKSAQTQEQLEEERSQREADAAAACSAAAQAQAAAAAAAEKINTLGGSLELQPHWMSWAWQQLLQSKMSFTSSAFAYASTAAPPTPSSSALDDGDDWLGLGDVLGTEQLQPQPVEAIKNPPSASALMIPSAHVPTSGAACGDFDDDHFDASFTIQNEVEDWLRGIGSCDEMGIMVREGCLSRAGA
jgi:hypothetical protein